MHQSKRFEESEQAFLAAHAMFGELTREAPELPIYRASQATVENSLGVFYRAHNRLPQAEQAHRRAVEVLAKLASDFPGQDVHVEEARTYMHLGLVLWRLNRRDEAVAAATRVLELDRRLGWAAKEPGNRASCAVHYHQLGRMLELSGKKVEAEKAYRNALAVAEQELAEYPDVAVGHEAWINVHFSLARLLAGSERLDAANELFQRIATWSPTSNRGLNLLAWLLATEPDTRFRNGKRALELARKLVERAPGEGMYRNTLGVAEYRVGDWKAAIASLDMSRVLLNRDHDSFNLFFLAMAHWQLGEKDRAGNYYREAVQWMEKNQPKNEELIRFRAEAAELLKN
jgi:tetratricopeptide (TPR) repeat protein